MWHSNETWNSKWNEILNDKAEIECALWNKWNNWNDIQNRNQIRHLKHQLQIQKNFLKKKNSEKKNSEKKIFSKKFFVKKKFQKKKFLKNFKKNFLQKKKISSNFFFSKNRICQTEFSNATKHLQKSNRHKESFFPTLACVTWPDLSPEL